MRAYSSLLATIATLALTACATEPATPQALDTSGSAAIGLAYSEQTCANCHAVGPGDAISTNPSAPPFAEIANTPGMTGLALQVWLQSPHPSMPHLLVEPERVDDVWAYISSLREPER